MLDHLIALYQPYITRFIVIVSPGFAEKARDTAHAATDRPVDVCLQERPTGMLDAVMLGMPAVRASDVSRIWITWCDQIAIHPLTVERLAVLSDSHAEVDIVMPVVRKRDPYIHFDRDEAGRIDGVRHRREGDSMPDIGEGDIGLFSLTRAAYLDTLPEYARSVGVGALTKERNLLPFIPWLASRRDVVTYPCTEEIESVGINTQDELSVVEAYLAARDRR